MSGYSLLSGVRVLEVAQLAPSSVGGHLADLGADVIKVETPGRGEGVRSTGARAVDGPDGPGFLHLRWNRGKRSIELDLRSDAGRAAFLRLAAEADAVVEGTRHGHLERLGLGFDALCRVRPQTVLCEVSGTGADGPYRDLATGGLWFDAYAGLRTVDTQNPSPPGVMGGSGEAPQAMYAIGAYGALAVLAGVLKARGTGEPVRVQVSSVDVATAWMPDRIDAALNADRTVPRPGWTPDGRLPDWPLLDAYATKDGGAMVFGSHTAKFWQHFCTAVDRPDLLEIDLATVDEGGDERALHVWRELDALFRTRTRAEWTDLFLAHDIAGGPVNTVADLLEDPHFRARATTYEVDGLRFAASPVRVVGEDFAPALAPGLGEHTEEVLGCPSPDS
ncbi:CaiB/BaiF CoA-transferase family protein [Pseudonocardia sp. WMMC193]|uniref:CaiB/BaiF CoA transferase family protein n=1 Tax=Pseudonocardia sp. WMMC193 TaxID=2911965 RepID=UPI001F37BCA5|nr:CoA transferase [Pseudonocardia sp. WMMC193]MCF7549514.1 CoA transferase [Pseudonocardia sp. WMMC193]